MCGGSQPLSQKTPATVSGTCQSVQEDLKTCFFAAPLPPTLPDACETYFFPWPFFGGGCGGQDIFRYNELLLVCTCKCSQFFQSVVANLRLSLRNISSWFPFPFCFYNSGIRIIYDISLLLPLQGYFPLSGDLHLLSFSFLSWGSFLSVSFVPLPEFSST